MTTKVRSSTVDSSLSTAATSATYVTGLTSANVSTALGFTPVSAGTSGFTNIVTYTSGSGTWTVPSGVTRFKVTVLGGGGGSASSNMAVPSIGGGGGGCAVKIFTSVTPGTSCSYTVGSGGTAGAWANPGSGGAGGDSVFSVPNVSQITGTGGAGGVVWVNNALFYLGASGGTGTGGDLNIPGGQSDSTIYGGSSYLPGSRGGNAPLGLGFGGRGAQQGNGAGVSAGVGYGAGAGGVASGTSAERTGVAGQPGIVIIEY